MNTTGASRRASRDPSRDYTGAADLGEALTTSQAAALAGIRPDTLRHYATKGLAPAPRRFGGSLVWQESEIRRWLADRPGRGARTDLRRSNDTGVAESPHEDS